jgi:hypothetical protein
MPLYASISPRNDALLTDLRLYKKHEVQEYKQSEFCVVGLVIIKPERRSDQCLPAARLCKPE